jgi:indolepyruvate ferredoxin oxidoreductase alpha subunit
MGDQKTQSILSPGLQQVDKPTKIKGTGSEAIARGAVEAGMVICSGRDGNPSIKIIDHLMQLAKSYPELKMHAEQGVNEKVGLEIAIGGTMSNARSLCAVTHSGLNIAADSFMTACYAGAMGGFVVVNVDDPGMSYTQNEQDNRWFGLHGLVPTFEPANPAEAYEMIKFAFEFSEKFESLVLFRTTTELIYAQDEYTVNPLKRFERVYRFDEEQRMRWTHLPTNARVNRVKLLDREKKIIAGIEEFPFNKVIKNPKAKLGIITAGTAFPKVLQTLKVLGLSSEVDVLKLGIVYPIPKQQIATFLKTYEKILIVEEIEPVLEFQIKPLAFDSKMKGKIFGHELFPQRTIITPENLATAIAKAGNFKVIGGKISVGEVFKSTPPTYCVNSLNTEIMAVLQEIKKEKIVFILASDLECNSPDGAAFTEKSDIFLTLGMAVGINNGIAKFEKTPVVAVVDKDTFFHSGISALMSAIYNENEMVVIIADPDAAKSIGQDGAESGEYRVNYLRVLEGISIPPTHIFAPSLIKKGELKKSIIDALQMKGVRIVLPITEEM